MEIKDATPIIDDKEFEFDFYNKKDPVLCHKNNLPHWHQDGIIQYLTFRLADSLPQVKLKELAEKKEKWMETHPLPWDEETQIDYQDFINSRLDHWLDSSYGECVLKNPQIRKIVFDGLMFFNNVKYRIYSFVIMPNHVHVLLSPIGEYKAIKEIGKVKSFTAKKINQLLGKEGAVWQREIFDRIVRSGDHFMAYDNYIINNPNGMQPDSYDLYHL